MYWYVSVKSVWFRDENWTSATRDATSQHEFADISTRRIKRICWNWTLPNAQPCKHAWLHRSRWRLRLYGTNRDVISDDGINYWKAPDGQLFTVLISTERFYYARALSFPNTSLTPSAHNTYHSFVVHLFSRFALSSFICTHVHRASSRIRAISTLTIRELTAPIGHFERHRARINRYTGNGALFLPGSIFFARTIHKQKQNILSKRYR